MIVTTGDVIAGSVFDAIYGKMIGDTLAGPTADVSSSAVVSAFEELLIDRLSISLKSQTGDIHMSLNYDPWTHSAWGIISSQCNPVGFLYTMELKPSGVFVEGSDHYYDLSNNGNEIR